MFNFGRSNANGMISNAIENPNNYGSPISSAINDNNQGIETKSPIQSAIGNSQSKQTNFNFSDVQNRWNNLGSEGQAKFLSQLLPKKQTQKQYAPISLNNGNIAYANFIDKYNIRKPLTNEEIIQAKAGGFNPGFEVTTKRYTDTRPGFFTDINAGLNENFYNDFQVNNLMPSKKGFGYRLGEGLGTLARGLSGALGDAYIAGYQGLDAAVGRQSLRNGNKLYRQRLKEMGYSDEDLSAIKGFITPDVYKNIANSYRLNNQVRWGDLAEFNPQIAEAIQNNPDLADSFAPSTIVQQILKTGLTDAQIANLLARTEKTKAETGQVGKPKVSINIKQGGTKSVIEHKGGSGENGSTDGKPVPKKNTTAYKEGQTATNPQTGEKMVFRGGKWQRL